jgi:hypothetical protein
MSSVANNATLGIVRAIKLLRLHFIKPSIIALIALFCCIGSSAPSPLPAQSLSVIRVQTSFLILYLGGIFYF